MSSDPNYANCDLVNIINELLNIIRKYSKLEFHGLGVVFQLGTGKSTMLLLIIDYLLLNTRCKVPDAIKALTFILSSTVVNAMVNDHVKAIKE